VSQVAHKHDAIEFHEQDSKTVQRL
jgi:hypothetical protein